jgi:hypothetical protein
MCALAEHVSSASQRKIDNMGLQVFLHRGLVVLVLAVDGAVRLYIDGRLETSGDGLRKLAT